MILLGRRRRTIPRYLAPMIDIVADSPHANVMRMWRRCPAPKANTRDVVRAEEVDRPKRFVRLCSCEREETAHDEDTLYFFAPSTGTSLRIDHGISIL